MIVIDDGSTDDTEEVLAALTPKYPFLRVVHHREEKPAGTRTPCAAAFSRPMRTLALVFFPADLQFKPEDIPRLVAPILAGESDMVTGFKQGKYEKAFVSGIYNGLSRGAVPHPRARPEQREGLPARNHGRPARAPRLAPVHDRARGRAGLYGHGDFPFRYIHPRNAGKSKFGISRIPIGVLDMLAVWFELRFGRKPLLAFGMLGAALFGIGLLAGLAALVLLFTEDIGVRAVWTVIQTCLILGSIFFSTGLLGEQIARCCARSSGSCAG